MIIIVRSPGLVRGKDQGLAQFMGNGVGFSGFLQGNRPLKGVMQVHSDSDRAVLAEHDGESIPQGLNGRGDKMVVLQMGIGRDLDRLAGH